MQGLQCFNDNFEQTLEVTDRITKVLGIFTKTLNQRTDYFDVIDDAFTQGGQPFVHCHMGNYVTSTRNVEPFTCLFIMYSLSGNRLRIEFGYTSDNAYANSTKFPFKFIIGVY